MKLSLKVSFVKKTIDVYVAEGERVTRCRAAHGAENGVTGAEIEKMNLLAIPSCTQFILPILVGVHRLR